MGGGAGGSGGGDEERRGGDNIVGRGDVDMMGVASNTR